MSAPLGFARELGGIVQLRMRDGDYELLELALAIAANECPTRELRLRIFELINALNRGNPEFTPYAIAAPAQGKRLQ